MFKALSCDFVYDLLKSFSLGLKKYHIEIKIE